MGGEEDQMKENIGHTIAVIAAVVFMSSFTSGCAGASRRVHDGAVLGATIGGGAGLVKGARPGHVVGLGLLGAAAGAVAGAAADVVFGGAEPVTPSGRGGYDSHRGDRGYGYSADGGCPENDPSFCEGWHKENERLAKEEARRRYNKGRNAARRGW